MITDKARQYHALIERLPGGIPTAEMSRLLLDEIFVNCKPTTEELNAMTKGCTFEAPDIAAIALLELGYDLQTMKPIETRH